MVERFSFDYDAGPAAPMEARRDAARAAQGWGLNGMGDTVRLLVSEAVTNAVRHARGPLAMELAWQAPTLRVAVTDTSATPPRLTERPLGAGGLGLVLIERLADDWGVEFRPRATGGGKVVWFTLSR